MTNVMFLISFLASVILCASSATVTITTDPNYEDGPIPWHQTVTIMCNWQPSARSPQPGDVLTDDDMSVWLDDMYGDLIMDEDPESRVVFSEDAVQGVASLAIKEITKADARNFQCNTPRIGSSDKIKLEILEPPTAAVVNLAAAPEFTTVTLTFDAVEEATGYKVGIQAAGEAAWEEAEITTTTHTFEGLTVATTYSARASARNAAGFRESVEPAETSFTTMDNRPPKPVDDLAVSSANYDDTVITITWSLATNSGVKHIINDITATVGLLDEEPALSQTLAADATTATFELEGPGTYEFTVTVSNDYSEGVDTAASVTHIVNPTTNPPTEKPTTKPAPTTLKEDTPAPPKTDPPVSEVECDGYSNVRDVLPGHNVTLLCIVPDEANYNATEITWSFDMGDDSSVMNQEQLADDDRISIVADNTEKQTQLTILSVTVSQQGYYKCSLGDENCEFQLIVTGEKVEGAQGGASRGCVLSGTATLLLVSLLLLALQ